MRMLYGCLGHILSPFIAQATIALADALNVPLDIRFTEPAEPLYIHADADDCQLLFIISTFPVSVVMSGPAAIPMLSISRP